MLKLDKKDYEILFQLELNARTPVSEIAKRVGISKQLASYKLRRLEKSGVILGYHAIVDVSALGLTSYRIYLKFQSLTSAKQEEIISYLVSLPEVVILLTIDGRWDVGFVVMVKDIYEFHSVWERIMRYRDVIDLYHTSVYSPIYQFTRTFLSPKPVEKLKTKTLTLGYQKKVDFDEWDIKILKALASNVRRPLTEIALKLKKSSQFVINRVKSLERRRIITGYLPILDWKLLGYDYYKVDITLHNHKRNKELFQFCKSHPYIFKIDQTIGTSDFEIEIYAHSKEHFRSIMSEIQDKFSDVFRGYVYFTLIKDYKETFMPL